MISVRVQSGTSGWRCQCRRRHHCSMRQSSPPSPEQCWTLCWDWERNQWI